MRAVSIGVRSGQPAASHLACSTANEVIWVTMGGGVGAGVVAGVVVVGGAGWRQGAKIRSGGLVVRRTRPQRWQVRSLSPVMAKAHCNFPLSMSGVYNELSKQVDDKMFAQAVPVASRVSDSLLHAEQSSGFE